MSEHDVVPLKDFNFVIDDLTSRLAKVIGEEVFYRMMVEGLLDGTRTLEDVRGHVALHEQRVAVADE